jgi:hypothetical protein
MNKTSKIQITTNFPNENEKRIDYVIVYKIGDEKSNDNFINAIRAEFFQKLRQENVEIKQIEFKNEKQNLIYAILHCPNERLMIEAEKIKLAVRINKVRFLSLISTVKNCLLCRKDFKMFLDLFARGFK